MWNVINGTVINAAAVVGGSVFGLLAGGKIPDRYRTIVIQALGLITITLGVDAGVLEFARIVERLGPKVGSDTYGARIAMVMISSLIVGVVIGTWLGLHERIESLGTVLHRRLFNGDGQRFAEGFLMASVIFCVGPLTLLGCLENGVHGDPSYLYIKSLLDGFCSMALASTFGVGVLFSVLTIVGFQGALSILAYWLAEPLDDLSLSLMTVVGGIILLATALTMLEIKKMPVANFLPGIFLPPLFVWIVEQMQPGLLLPVA